METIVASLGNTSDVDLAAESMPSIELEAWEEVPSMATEENNCSKEEHTSDETGVVSQERSTTNDDKSDNGEPDAMDEWTWGYMHDDTFAHGKDTIKKEAGNGDEDLIQATNGGSSAAGHHSNDDDVLGHTSVELDEVLEAIASLFPTAGLLFFVCLISYFSGKYAGSSAESTLMSAQRLNHLQRTNDQCNEMNFKLSAHLDNMSTMSTTMSQECEGAVQECQASSFFQSELEEVSRTLEWIKETFEDLNATLGAMSADKYKDGYVEGWDDGRKQGYREALADLAENERANSNEQATNGRYYLSWSKAYIRGFHQAAKWNPHYDAEHHQTFFGRGPWGMHDACMKMYESMVSATDEFLKTTGEVDVILRAAPSAAPKDLKDYEYDAEHNAFVERRRRGLGQPSIVEYF